MSLSNPKFAPERAAKHSELRIRDTSETTQFVYLLEWPDEAAKSAAWSAFMRDGEWAEIKRVTSAQHGALVGAIEDRVLTPLDYSPASGRSMIAA